VGCDECALLGGDDDIVRLQNSVPPFAQSGKPASYYADVYEIATTCTVPTSGTLSVSTKDSFTMNVKAAGLDRCVTAYVPEGASNAPLMIHFSTEDCATKQDQHGRLFGDETMKRGIALVCFNNRQWVDSSNPGCINGEPPGCHNSWDIPMMQSDATGTPCEDTDTNDLQYIDAVLDKLDTDHPGVIDTSKVYVNGFSVGSQFAMYAAACLRNRRGSSFVQSLGVTHGGLNNKDVDPDSKVWAPDGYARLIENEVWAPDGYAQDQYWPFVPKAKFNKVCVYDGTEDGDFYVAAQYLVEATEASGSSVEYSWLQGGAHSDFEGHDLLLACHGFASKGQSSSS